MMNRREFMVWVAGAAIWPAAGNQTDSPLYMLTYDHGGVIGWGVEDFMKRLRNAVEWMDRYPSFKIGLDNEAYAYDYMAEERPELLQELRGYLVKYRGRLGIGTCTYGQPLMHFLNEESNIRQILHAMEAERRNLGWTPTVYLMSEHALHSQIPQILAGLGFKAAIMRTPFMMYGYNPTFDVDFGWWVGVDGSRIPAVPTYKGEGAEFGKQTEDDWILSHYPVRTKESPADFKAKFARIKPLIATRAQDSGLRCEELVREYEGKPGYRWILLEEILPNFPPPVEEMKTAPNDFKVRMPWGYCGNEIWNTNRQAEVAVLTAERLAAIELLLGGANREEELQRAWKKLLMAQHHDIQIVGLVKQAREYLNASLQSSRQVTQASLQYVAGHMQGGAGGQVTVFNPHSWPRKEWIEIELPRNSQDLAVTRAGRPVAFSPLGGERTARRIAILADVPALGFASYSLTPGEKAPPSPAPRIELDEKNLQVVNKHWRIRLHPDGGLAAIEDRRTGQTFLKGAGRGSLLAGRIEGNDCESRGEWSFTPGPAGAPWIVACERGAIGGIRYTLELTVHAESPRLDFRISCHIENQRIGVLSKIRLDTHSAFIHEAKLRFKLFPSVESGTVGVRDVPFAVAETSDPYLQGIYWTALSDGRAGLAVFNRGTMCSVRETDGGFSIPLAFAMYYVWGTRMLTGDYSYQFALYPFAGDWPSADIHQHALEHNFPLVAIHSDAGDGRLGDEWKPLQAGSANVVLSALYPAGGCAYARLYESRGKSGRVKLRYLGGRARLTEVDLAGNEQRRMPSSLSFRPWQIRTVRIKPSP